MCTKFQVDWTSTSSKTTSTKNFNLKRDRRTNERTNAQTGKHMIMPINGALKKLAYRGRLKPFLEKATSTRIQHFLNRHFEGSNHIHHISWTKISIQQQATTSFIFLTRHFQRTTNNHIHHFPEQTFPTSSKQPPLSFSCLIGNHSTSFFFVFSTNNTHHIFFVVFSTNNKQPPLSFSWTDIYNEQQATTSIIFLNRYLQQTASNIIHHFFTRTDIFNEQEAATSIIFLSIVISFPWLWYSFGSTSILSEYFDQH